MNPWVKPVDPPITDPEAKLETAVFAAVEPIKPAPKDPPPIQELTPKPTPADNAPAAAPIPK